MPDLFDNTGLQVKDLEEIKEDIIEDLQDIYGDDINVEQNSPDGQQINIYAQASVDTRELLVKIYNSFDPDKAEGRVLDQRIALNNIKRKQGTFTFQDISIEVDRSINLVGLDGEANTLEPDITDLYTVKDDEGNKFYLLSSQTISTSGIYSYTFRAKELGKVETTVNTITTPVTILAGVVSVNNPNSANSVGEEEETDVKLKLRRKISTSISATGPVDTLEGYLNNLDLVTYAKVYENAESTTDLNDVPPRSIWVVIEGGDPDEIGEAIYAKRTMGVGMRGEEEVDVLRPNGLYFTAKYDRPISQNLWIKFSISLTGGYVDEAYIKEEIVNNISWKLGSDAKSSKITAYLQGLNEDYVIENMQVSADGITYAETASVTSVQYRFVNSEDKVTIL